MEPEPKKPLKIALIVDSQNVSTQVHALVQWVRAQENIHLSHLIVQNLPEKNTPSSKILRALHRLKNYGAKAFLSRVLWAIIYRVERARLSKTRYANHFATHSLNGYVDEIIQVTPEISASGLVYRYRADDIVTIKAQQFDVLLRCGSGILRGDILAAARFGVLSFHHGDNRINRGIPAGFWEVFHQQPSTGFIIQQLTQELDGGNVVVRGAFPTQRYWLANQAALYARSNGYMQQLLLKLATQRILPAIHQSVPYANPLYKTPSFSIQLRYMLQLAQHKLGEWMDERVLRKQRRWGVAFAYSDWRQLVMHKAIRITNPKGHFLADPFVIMRDGRDYCFVEDYDEAAARGSISVYELTHGKPIALGTALAETFHLSFPYLFEYGSTLYMIPESAENDDIRLYECVEFPLRWRLKRVIMRGVSAADTMVFQHGDDWWLFTNMNPLGRGDHCSELFAFHTRNPIDGEWIPHVANPLIIDPLQARNGGILYDSNGIYRVSQRYGFVQYGAGAAIRAIERLDSEQYSERLVCEIEPNFFKHLVGTHHMHSNGRVTAFDFLEEMPRTHL